MMKMKSEELRDMLAEHADITKAVELANELGEIVNDRINGANVSMATSLMARAMLTRALRLIAAEWWADVIKHPMPVTFAALQLIEHDPPPQIITNTWKDEAR